MIKQETYTAVRPLSLETRLAHPREQKNIELEITLVINDEDYGYFELFDTETGGSIWNAGGGLWLEGTTVTADHGVLALPKFITNKLNEWGYDTADVE